MGRETSIPILFNGPMVRAILDGRKTQTRRVMKLNAAGRAQFRGRQWHIDDPNAVLACPYGQPSDRLWVRETWYPAFRRSEGSTGVAAGVIYRADYGHRDDLVNSYTPCNGWKPSIRMPRWASRITLELTEVRIERVQDISDRDCEAEGVRPSVDGDAKDWRYAENGWHRTYRQLWDDINARRGFGWDTNPHVWALTFRKVESP